MFRLLWLNCIFLFFITVYCQISSPQTDTSTCGSNTIPFEFRVEENSVPQIRCSAAPTCFGAKKFENDGTYAYGNRHFQKDAIVIGAECSERFSEQVCSSENEWTTRIQKFNNGSHFILQAQCCHFNGLANATTATNTYSIRNGEYFVGGGVLDSEGKIVGFDLIKEVRKNIDENNEAIYLVTVNRMTCNLASEEYSNQIPSNFNNDGIYDSEGFEYRQRDSPDMYMSPSYISNNRRYHQIHRAPTPRRYPPRQRHYYRQAFDDEYDYYYDSESMPQKPYRRQYRSRYEPEQYYLPKQRPRAYSSDPYTYQNNEVEPLEGYRRSPIPPPYQTNQDPAPTNFVQQPLSRPSNPGTQLLPPPHQQQSLSPFFQPHSLLPPPPPLPLLPQLSNQINSNPFSLSSLQTLTNKKPAAAALASQTVALNDIQPGQQLYDQPTSGFIPAQQQQQFSSGDQSSSYYSGQQPAYSQSASSHYSSSSGCGGGSSCDLNGAMSSLQCFSGDMTVQTPSGFKRMDELEIGDMILSIEQSMISFTPVVMFLHNDPEETAIFKEIETADNQKLKLTEYHLIYVTDCKPGPYKLIHAKDVKVGQCLEIVDEVSLQSLKSVEVIAIREIEQHGIYAPLTASGDLMVNSVYASCHSNMGIQTLQQTFFAFYRKLNGTISSVLKMFGIGSAMSEAGKGLPFGVQYLTSVIDVIVPKTLLS